MEAITIPSDWDVTFFHSDTCNTLNFLCEAATSFASCHTGYPDGIIVEIWRRISTLPAENWHDFNHGPIKICLYSIGSSCAPDMFNDYKLEADSVICFRAPCEKNNVLTE